MAFISVYNLSVTGDCTNSGLGAVSFQITGDSPTFTVYEATTTGLLPTDIGVTSYSATGLTGFSYFVYIQDSTPEPPNIFGFNISSGITVSLNATGSVCGNNSGSITASTQSVFGSNTFTLYDISGNVIDVKNAGTFATFDPVSANTYYVTVSDEGGCSGTSETVLIYTSDTLNFGSYVVDNYGCNGTPNGKIYITGITGTPPYTYSCNGQTGSTITGLTQGFYPVTVTDSIGCSLTNIIEVGKVDPVNIGLITVTQPSCFGSDGTVTVQLLDGTAPFFYSGSNGENIVSFSTSHTFTNVSPGIFNILVQDSGFCSTSGSTNVITTNSFSVTNITVTNSFCGNLDGSISVTLNSSVPSGTYTYQLIDSFGNTVFNVNENTVFNYNGLSSGTYTLIIDDGACVYTETIVINNVDKFRVNTVITRTSCGLDNGSVTISTTSGGTLPYTYQIIGPVGNPVTYPYQVSNTFNGLPSGTYTVYVQDSSGCIQTINCYVSPSQSVSFTLLPVNPVTGNDGQISTMITTGSPPFTYLWSPGGQTTPSITNIPSGTYTLQVTDSDNCTLTKSVTLKGTRQVSSYETYTVCEKLFKNTGQLGKRGILQMFNEGFYDLTLNDFGCIVNSAQFIVQVKIDEGIKENLFYVSSGITDYPNELQYLESVRQTLQEFPGVGIVEFDINKNEITIFNDCTEIQESCQPYTYNQYDGSNFVVNLKIVYDISCIDCGLPPITTTTTIP
jgi:hypothetical protein